MVDQVVVHQRLFDHCQIEFIEIFQHRQIGRRIGAVAVDMNRDIGKCGTDRRKHIRFPARTEFQLHARIAGSDGMFDSGKQFVIISQHAEGVTDRTEIAPAPDHPIERLAFPACQKIPQRRIECRFRVHIAADRLEQFLKLLPALEFTSQQARRDKVTCDDVTGMIRIRRKERTASRSGFAPPRPAFAFQ